jgi:hypothetical protein
VGGDAPYLISIKILERGDVAKLDEVIGIYTYHECSLLEEKVHSFRKLILQ